MGLAVVVACAGCGDNTAPPGVVGIEAGARLEPRFWSAEGGARVLRAWFDRELGVECTFQLATDGRYRCLPVRGPLASAFADAACTTPIVIVPACSPVPAMAPGRGQATATCDEDAAVPVYPVGAVRASTEVYFGAPGNSCLAATLDAELRAYDLGAEVAPGTFVGADLVVRASGADRVAPYALVADDGAVENVGQWDTERDGECTGGLRCVPTEIALHDDFLYSDDTCTVPAAADLSSVRPCARATAVLTSDAPFGTHFLALGAEVPAAAVHRSDGGGTCSPESGAFAEHFYLEGAPIPLETLPALMPVREGTGRLRAERYEATPGTPLAAATFFFDDELGTPCAPTRFADGWRCLRNDQSFPEARYFFADPDCETMPLALVAAPPPALAVVNHVAADACDTVRYDAAYLVGDEVVATLVYTRQGTACISRPVEAGEHLYRVGAPVDLPRLTP